jgi:hypothetical protein
MQFFKGLLLLILFFAIVLGGGYVARRYLHLSPAVANVLNTATTVPQQLLSTGQTTISQAIPAVEQGGQVLGAQINVKKSDKSIPERAFEYGRYQYCVQVVKDYEEQQSATTESGTTH